MKFVAGILLTFSLSAAAAIPQPGQTAQPKIKNQDGLIQTADAIGDALSKILGHGLNVQQRAELEQMLEQESAAKIVTVDYQPLRNINAYKAIYCVGVHGALVYAVQRAVCVNVQSLKGYDLAVLGAGYNASFEFKVFRLTVGWDSTRYDRTFDPIPGTYAQFTDGVSLGFGGSRFVGDAGNKVISGFSANFGFGLDLGSFAALVLQ